MKRITDPLRLLLVIGLILIAEGWNFAYYEWVWFRRGVKILLGVIIVGLIAHMHIYGACWVTSMLLMGSVGTVAISAHHHSYVVKLEAAVHISSCIEQLCFNHMVGGTPRQYPTYRQLQEMIWSFPENPFSDGPSSRVVVEFGSLGLLVPLDEAGWVYQPESGSLFPTLPPSLEWWPEWLSCK